MNKHLIEGPEYMRPVQNQEENQKYIVITEVPMEQKEKLPAFLSEDEIPIFKQLLPQLEELTDKEQDELITREIFAKRQQIP